MARRFKVRSTTPGEKALTAASLAVVAGYPAITDVRDGVFFGTSGTEFEGTLDLVGDVAAAYAAGYSAGVASWVSPARGTGLGDPFTETYNAIWTALEASPEFAATVKPGNRIRFSEDSRPFVKGTLQDGDLPEVTVLPAGGVYSNFSSTSGVCKQVFLVRCVTGGTRLDLSAFPLKWAILQALVAAGSTLNCPHVINTLIGDVTDLWNAPEDNRAAKGWSFQLTITVDIRFNKAGRTIGKAR